MRTFGPAQPDAGSEAPAGVVPLDEVPEAVHGTFSVFAEKLAADGFAFLDSRIRSSGTGPVFTCQRDAAVVGAIGPMEIMPDSREAAQLLPQYFDSAPMLWRPPYLRLSPGISGAGTCRASCNSRGCQLERPARRTQGVGTAG